jgi:hypothetical protein
MKLFSHRKKIITWYWLGKSIASFSLDLTETAYSGSGDSQQQFATPMSRPISLTRRELVFLVELEFLVTLSPMSLSRNSQCILPSLVHIMNFMSWMVLVWLLGSPTTRLQPRRDACFIMCLCSYKYLILLVTQEIKNSTNQLKASWFKLSLSAIHMHIISQPIHI